MNVNIEELKRLAEAVINCTDAGAAVQASMDFMEEIDPAVTLSLIGEIERLTAMCEVHKRHHADAVASHKVQRDELVAALKDARRELAYAARQEAHDAASAVIAKVEG